MAPTDLRRELSLAERLAREAGALVLEHHARGVAVEYKGDESPVTQADRDASELIVAALERAFPGDGVLSEELPDTGAWRGRERVWMIDPLDGTRDFVRGRSGYSVMIGLCIGERPALGVVFRPTTGVLYRAALGTAAERVDEDGRAARMRVSAIAEPGAIRLVASASHRTAAVDRVREALKITDEQNIGSVGLKLGLIAEGARDLYVNPAGRSSIWDTCGPEAILVEAGGRLTDLAGAPLPYRGESLKNERGLVASNDRLHDRVIEEMATLFPGGRVED